MPHHREVVRDEQERQLVLLLQFLQQVDDLRLDRDVERGDRLVAHDEGRLHRQRARDAHALALAAGEFVRVALRHVLEQPHLRQQLRHLRARRLAVGTSRYTRIGSAMISPMVMRGFNELYGSWKITWILRR